MAKFKVGDKVVMNKLANDRYTISKAGSWGYITEASTRGFYRVDFKEFKTISGRKSSFDLEEFEIEAKYMDLYGAVDDGKTDLERKINMMFKRQPYYEHKVMV